MRPLFWFLILILISKACNCYLLNHQTFRVTVNLKTESQILLLCTFSHRRFIQHIQINTEKTSGHPDFHSFLILLL